MGNNANRKNKKVYGLINNFKNIPISNNGTKNSIEYNANIVNIDPSQDYNSNTGSIFLTSKARDIHNLTLLELNRARYGDENHDTDTTACLGKDINGLFLAGGDNFWLSDAYSDTELYYVKHGGAGLMEHLKNGWIGIRPVITLNFPIYKSDDVWKIR